jgi:1-acyl-sn-glycerol-3-phosphate acyltransferase
MLPRLIRTCLITDPLIVLCTAVMGTVSMVVSFLDRSGRASHEVARIWARMLLFVSGVKVRVEGLENIPAGQGLVFASNHLSLMDTPLVVASIPAQFRFLAKQSLFKVPFIGGHLKRAGHVSVPREDPRASVKVMAVAADLIQRSGVSILVFPEGGRSMGQLQEFKEGGAYIAIKAQAPIVPMAITGTLEILPSGSINLRSGRATLRIGEPISTAGLKLSDRGQLTARLREEIVKLLDAPVSAKIER